MSLTTSRTLWAKSMTIWKLSLWTSENERLSWKKKSRPRTTRSSNCRTGSCEEPRLVGSATSVRRLRAIWRTMHSSSLCKNALKRAWPRTNDIRPSMLTCESLPTPLLNNWCVSWILAKTMQSRTVTWTYTNSSSTKKENNGSMKEKIMIRKLSHCKTFATNRQMNLNTRRRTSRRWGRRWESVTDVKRRFKSTCRHW